MLKEHSSFIKQLIALIDCLLIFGAFYLATILTVPSENPFSVMFKNWFVFIGFLVFYLYFAWTRSLFSVLHFSWMTGLLSRLIMIFVFAGLFGAALLYLFPKILTSRFLYLTFISFSFLFIGAEKLFLTLLITFIRKHGKNITPVFLIGRGRELSLLYQEIKYNPGLGIKVIKKMDILSTPLKEFENILKNTHVEEVFFSIPRNLSKNGFSIDPYLQVCEEMGRPARVFLNIPSSTYFARWEYHRFMNRPTLISHTVELDPDQLLFKRIFDIIGAIVGICILFVFYPFLAIAIKLTSKGPVFFKQKRIGKNGKPFVIYKFRSMVADAEKKKEELLSQNELNGAVFKIKNDPRVTKVGRFMRRFSLDELPQFINVLKGEMSLVGTRPPTPDEVAQYEKWHCRRISIKPGLTGLWQVSGRNKIKSFDEIVKLDLQYIDNWSIWLDIKIILKTFKIIFDREAAY